jgi:hypothetical protein
MPRFFDFAAAPRRAPRLGRAIARIGALTFGLATGCGGTPPVATAMDAARANVELADLERGRSLMLAKCGGCHRAPMPTDHKPAEWPHAVGEMAERSKLDATQRHLIEQYLITMATR